jgi:hypothetical protein
MRYVRPLRGGLWPTAAFNLPREWERTLVMALESGVWAVNRGSVAVEPGVVVSFDESSDADFFLSSGRGTVPVSNMYGPPFFIFDDENDAFHFVREGWGEFIIDDEAQALVANSQTKQEPTMLTTKPKVNAIPISTRMMTPAEQTKTVTPKRVPAPAKAAAKAKAR